MSVRLSGASDDLIEIDGDIREEFPLPSEEEALLAFSDGNVLRIIYSASGVWRITPVIDAGLVEIVQAPEDDDDNYSDVATLGGDVTWVVLGTAIVRRDLGKHPIARLA